MKEFSITGIMQALTNGPSVFAALLNGLSAENANVREHENTWTVKEVMAHLVVCEETNWLPRAKIILLNTAGNRFTPVDMEAHFARADRYDLQHLLNEFALLRKNGVQELAALNLQQKDLEKTGLHPKLGSVTLKQLLATWATHDLAHLAQITRLLARQNKPQVGPFEEYLNILKS